MYSQHGIFSTCEFCNSSCRGSSDAGRHKRAQCAPETPEKRKLRLGKRRNQEGVQVVEVWALRGMHAFGLLMQAHPYNVLSYACY